MIKGRFSTPHSALGAGGNEMQDVTQAMNKTTKDKPVHEIRLGAIRAAIWKNDTETGARYNTTVSRLYRDGEEWKSAESFGRDDLLVLAKVVDHAHSWICEQQVQESDRERGNR
jgi:hypothetical protein